MPIDTSINETLEKLLSQSLAQVQDLERKITDSVAVTKERPPLLFGAGALGEICLTRLRRAEIEPLAFVDNNSKRWNTTVAGIPVISLPQALERFGNKVPYVVTIYTGATVIQQLRTQGLNIFPFSHLALQYAKAFLPFNCLERPYRMCGQEARIRQGFDVWADNASREEYVAQVRYRYTLDGPLPPFLPPETIYFPEDLLKLKNDEVFVDCGAYNGDSIQTFVDKTNGNFSSIVGIEADSKNIAALKTRLAAMPEATRSRIQFHPIAASDLKGTIRFEATGTVASTQADSGSSSEIPCDTLDSLLKQEPPVTYIKMDIEGGEPEALAGARQTIQRHAPVLAICLYHRQSDLWEIPLQIRAMTDRYKFFLRRYSDDCWEQVLYAIPTERIAA